MNTWAKKGFVLSLLFAFGLLTLGIAREDGSSQDQTGQASSKVTSVSLKQVTLPEDITTIEGKMLYRMRVNDRSHEFTPAQVSRRAYLQNQRAAKLEPDLILGAGLPTTFEVPGGGDIFEVFHAPFDSSEQLEIWDFADIEGNGNDFFILDYRIPYGNPAYWVYNTLTAPTPGPDGFFSENATWGHPDAISAGPKEYTAEIYVGFPDEDSVGTPYQVAEVYLDLWLENDDPDDYLAFEIAEGPKWHLVDGEWGMTSNQYSVPGYGNEWREDLVTPVIDLTSAAETVTLSFDHTYDMESTYWDGGTIWARVDESSDWVVVTPAGGYNSDGGLYAWYYHGIASGASAGGYGTYENEIPGFTGELHTAATVTVDLTSYIGGTVQVRWAFASDAAYSAEAGNAAETLGWFVDNIDISDDSGSLFSNDGSEVGDMVAERLGLGEEGPWVELGRYGNDPGAGSLEKFVINNNIIGAPGDTLGLRLRAVFDGDDSDATALWGFEVGDVLVMTYTRMAYDLSATFADLGDSVLTDVGYTRLDSTYDIIARVSNVGLSDFSIYNTHAVVEDAFGNEVYHRFIYTYASDPEMGDTLYAYPDYQDFNDAAGFYNFPDWTPVEEGDYTLSVYPEVFGGDDDPENDVLSHTFHAYSAPPTYTEDFNAPTTDSSLFADGWSYESVQGDTSFLIADYFGEGDTEIWWYTAIAGADLMDETVITPPVDLTGTTGNAMYFAQYMNNTASAGAEGAWTLNILGRPDAETAWTVLSSVNGASPYELRYTDLRLDISAFDGEADFQAGFQFKMSVPGLVDTTATGYATIDDIIIYPDADLAAPAGPTGLVAVSGDREAFLSWDAGGSDVMYYSIYVADTADASVAEQIDNVPGSEVAYVAEDLVNNSTFYFFVSATDLNGNESALSASASAVPADVTAPTAVTDLTITNIDEVSALLTWSAPFESRPEEGTFYEIRTSLDPIGEDTWDDATIVVALDDSFFVAAEDAMEEYTVDVEPGVDNYFALKAVDEEGQVSAMSNVVNNDDMAPDPITDLKILGYNDGSLTLRWTATGDDGFAGVAAEFDLRVAFGADLVDWDIAVPLAGIPEPGEAGSVHFFHTGENVYPDYALAFGIMAIDNNGNESPVSNIVSWRPDGIVPPEITEVADISEDQGRQVRVSWSRSEFDGLVEGDPTQTYVKFYSLWRLISEASGSAPVTEVSGYLELFESAAKAEINQSFKVLNPNGTINSEWDYIATIPAHDDALYHCVAPTLHDSVVTTFMASAHSELGYIANSVPAAGMSIDDLAPSQVTGLYAVTTPEAAIQLIWDANADEYLDADLANYVVYRNGEQIGTTEVPEFIDADVITGVSYDYYVTAVDYAGNEGIESETVGTALGVTAEAALPETYMLSQNYPNPFNPVTRIEFALPEEANVVLTIYNMLGQEVNRLAEGRLQAGYHTVLWNATDSGQRHVPSGVYFYSIQAGGFTKTMKMVLLK